MKNTESKKFIALVLIFVSFCSIFYPASDAYCSPLFVSLKVNGKLIKTEASPFVKGSQPYLPLKFITEALGKDYVPVENEKKVMIVTEEALIELFYGSNTIITNGEKSKIDANLEKSGNQAMVPISFITKILNCPVNWDSKNYIVSINNKDLKISESQILKRSYSDEDLLWLARIIHVEGNGLSLNTKLAIANVVLNRKKSGAFPNTIKGVIFQPGQFPPAHRSSFKTLNPTNECKKAAKMALENINNISKCLYFCDVPFRSSRITLYKKMDGMYFYY